MNPINLRPIDPKWVSLCDDVAERAAKELGCLVVMVALQEGGKMGITVGGNGLAPLGPECAAAMHLLDNDAPSFFSLLAVAVKIVEEFDEQETRQ